MACILFGITLALFWPTLVWMGRETVVHEQMRHAFGVLVLGCLALLQERGRRLPLVMRMGRLATAYLAGAFGLLAAGLVLRSGFLVLVAGALAAVGWLIFFCGGQARRAALGVGLVFVVYTLLILSLPWLDWPLRVNAGYQSAWVLNVLGIRSQLLLMDPEAPRLILLVGRHPFEVAADCNGFGLLAGSLLLALLLAGFRPGFWLDKVLLVVAAMMLAVAGNTLRILGIVALAPHFSASAYVAIHEAVGITFFWGTLVAVWWLAHGLPFGGRGQGCKGG